MSITLLLSSLVAGLAYVVLFGTDGLADYAPQDFWQGLALVAGIAVVAMAAMHFTQRADVRTETPPAKPFVPRAFTEEELAWYDGVRNSKAARKKREGGLFGKRPPPDAPPQHPLPEYDDLIFVGVKGKIYNVSPDFYGPGCAYNAFAGCDASRQLGKVVVGRDEINADWTTNFSAKHAQTLDEWEAKYQGKYNVVGWITFGPDFVERAKKLEP